MASASSIPITIPLVKHAQHCKRCLTGLPPSQASLDTSRVAVSFYCLGALDIMGLLETQTREQDRRDWVEWLWSLQISGPNGSGFRPGSYLMGENMDGSMSPPTKYDTPHLIMTYTALLALSILRDNFSRLDRSGLLRFLRAAQEEDGSFSDVPKGGESDMRIVYCAFVISALLNDWSGVDVPRALSFVRRCRTYEGAYGQSPHCEAQGGTTYCALAVLHLAPTSHPIHPTSQLTPQERDQTRRWLTQKQADTGGFRGRTEKDPDACYSFWCGASLKILGGGEWIDANANASWLSQCTFKWGGIAPSPDSDPDPFHTYMALASLAMYPGDIKLNGASALAFFNPLINATAATAQWAFDRIPHNR